MSCVTLMKKHRSGCAILNHHQTNIARHPEENIVFALDNLTTPNQVPLIPLEIYLKASLDP